MSSFKLLDFLGHLQIAYQLCMNKICTTNSLSFF